MTTLQWLLLALLGLLFTIATLMWATRQADRQEDDR